MLNLTPEEKKRSIQQEKRRLEYQARQKALEERMHKQFQVEKKMRVSTEGYKIG